MNSNPFGDYKYVPGIGFVEPMKQDEVSRGGLQGEDSVMMISGLADTPGAAPGPMAPAPVNAPQPQGLMAMAQNLPWYVWLFIGVALGILISKRGSTSAADEEEEAAS